MERTQIAIVTWLDADEESGNPPDHRCLRMTVGFINPEDDDKDYLILWTDRDIDDDDPKAVAFSGRIRVPHGMVKRVIRRSFPECPLVASERKDRLK